MVSNNKVHKYDLGFKRLLIFDIADDSMQFSDPVV